MLYLILISIAVISRLIPHVNNIAPVGALALFIGATGLNLSTTKQRYWAFAIPFIALLVSDAVIGFYKWQVMVVVYLSYGLALGLGVFVRQYYNWTSVIIASLASSLLFFLLTNAAVWAFTPMYTKTLAGLAESYTMAIPFFRNSLVGDLLYTGVLFGVYELTHYFNRSPIRLWRTSQG